MKFPWNLAPKDIYGSLKDMSDEKLEAFLKDAENIDGVALAGICAEVLRRMIINKKGK